jgi:hypothetical protein
MIGYTWAITLGGFGKYHPSEEIFPTIEALVSSIAERYPEYQDYYGIDRVQRDEDGFWDFLEEIKPIPKVYYEDAE